MVLLYVDDDSEDILLFNDAIESINPNFICLSAGNGEEALSILNDITPDIIFLEVNLPIMNGRKTLEAIRGDRRLHSVPVCMLSTTSNPKEIEIYKELGATGFIVKQSTFKRYCDFLTDFLSVIVNQNPRAGQL